MSTQPITLRADGAEATICPRGAHVMTWTPAGATASRLWMSPDTPCGSAGALRGGVPVLFPQFSGFGPLVKHGFARTSPWEVVEAEAARVVFRLVATESTRAIWDHAFELLLTVDLTATTLGIAMRVTNLDGGTISFGCGLHTYLAVSDVAGVELQGLTGRPTTNFLTGQPGTWTSMPELAAGTDMATHWGREAGAPTGPVTVVDAELPPLVVHQTGFLDTVVWNPGPNDLPDAPAGAQRGWVCVEPAMMRYFDVPAGGVWEGRQVLEQLA